MITELERVNRKNSVSLSKGNFSDGRRQGTWVHPDLAVECLRWIRPAFAIWCNRAVHRILSGEYPTAHKLPGTYPEALKELVSATEARDGAINALQAQETITRQLEDRIRPIEAFHAQIMTSKSTVDWDEAARLLGTGKKRLFWMLKDLGMVLDKDNNTYTPKQVYMDKGYSRWSSSRPTRTAYERSGTQGRPVRPRPGRVPASREVRPRGGPAVRPGGPEEVRAAL